MKTKEKNPLNRHPKLTDEVARHISDAIRRDEYKPGERLPNESTLCEMYGVSRPVLREAISMLKHNGLVVPQQGRGVFVSEKGFVPTLRFEVPDFDNKQEFVKILELLHAVEVYYTGLAAKNRTEEQLRSIKSALDELIHALENGGVGIEEDLIFHREIVKATNNYYFEAIVCYLEENMRNAIRIANHSTQPSNLDLDLIKEHRVIFQAIEEQNIEKTRQAAETHLINAANRLTKCKKEISLQA